MSTVLPLYVNDEFRAITNNDFKRDKAVMMSSAIPSAKYSCSGSPLMLVNGSTAIEGLSGRGSVAPPVGRDGGLTAAISVRLATAERTANSRNGRSIIFSSLSPGSLKKNFVFLLYTSNPLAHRLTP